MFVTLRIGSKLGKAESRAGWISKTWFSSLLGLFWGFSDQGRFRVFLTMGNQGGAGGDQNVGNVAAVEFLAVATEAPLTDRDWLVWGYLDWQGYCTVLCVEFVAVLVGMNGYFNILELFCNRILTKLDPWHSTALNNDAQSCKMYHFHYVDSTLWSDHCEICSWQYELGYLRLQRKKSKGRAYLV